MTHAEQGLYFRPSPQRADEQRSSEKMVSLVKVFCFLHQPERFEGAAVMHIYEVTHVHAILFARWTAEEQVA